MSIRDYRFVLTIVWVSFIIALSFIETPLRFMGESVSRIAALSIGHLVFHALNYCELVFASLLLLSEFSCRLFPSNDSADANDIHLVDSAGDDHLADRGNAMLFGRSSKTARRFLLLVVALLLVQTVMLFTILDWRTLAIINGQPVEEAMYHVTYIVMELIKLTLLLVLATKQIHSFKEQCSRYTRY